MMNIPQYNYILQHKHNKRLIKEEFNDFYNMIIKSFEWSKSWGEKIYCYYNQINKIPCCPICGKPLTFLDPKQGYRKYCSPKCAHKDINYINNIKQTCLERYGVENVFQNKEIQFKQKQTMIMHYGVDNPQKNHKIKEKTKQTCLERYGVDNYMKTYSYKEIIHNNQDIIKQKVYNTRKKNHTFNTSQIEQQFKKWLDDNNIEYKYQYKSEEYPFVCDFYFPLKDLYLEIQGSWVHGYHPFNPSNKEDIKTLNEWKEKNTKYYDYAIETWTIRDIEKREIGKKLNWMEVFTNDINELITFYTKNK